MERKQKFLADITMSKRLDASCEVALKEYHSSEDAKDLLRRADDIVQGIFYFIKPWDMERCATPYSLGSDPYSYNFNMICHDDEEWCFMLNRMDYLDDLILATLMTGKESYAVHALAFIDAWIAAHPTIEYSLSTRTLDTAIRMRAWVHALPYLVEWELIDNDQIERIVASLQDQMQYLRAQWLPKYTTSNWGSIQTASIVEIYALLGLPEDDLLVWARDMLELQIDAQFYPDGVNWELSPMYHVEVMLSLLGVHAAYKKRGVSFSDKLKTCIKRAACALAHQTLAHLHIDAQGDSDETSVASLLAVCAALLNCGELKSIAQDTKPSLYDLYACGFDLYKAYQEVASHAYNTLCFDGHYSGVYSARSDWSNEASATLLLNGTLGSGHGHGDNGHISLSFKGTPLFVDAGRYTYREDDFLRPYLKSPEAHNSVIRDGYSSSKPKGSWSYESFVKPLKTYSSHVDGIHYWESAYVEANPLTVIVRKLFFIDIGIWIGCDEMLCDNRHSMVSRFHIAPGVNASQLDDTTYDLGEVIFQANHPTKLDKAVISRQYNQQQTTEVLKVSSDFEDVGNVIWSVIPKEYTPKSAQLYQGDTLVTDESLAHALCIRISEDESYSFAIFHKEVAHGIKAFSLEGIPFHAKAVCVHRKGSAKRLIVLSA